MWSVIFISLGLCYGALARDEQECLLRAEGNCRYHNIIPGVFPTNIEELRNDCLNLYRVKQCIADTVGNCSLENADGNENDDDYDSPHSDPSRESQRVTDMQRLINLITEICDENSELHRNFVPYLSCVKSAMDKQFEEQSCRDYDHKVFDLLRTRIDGKIRMAAGNDEKKERDIRYGLYGCLRVVFGMNCFIDQFMEACDSGVKQPVLELIEKGGSLYYQCPDSIRIDVIELLDALKLVTQKEIHVKELIQINSFF